MYRQGRLGRTPRWKVKHSSSATGRAMMKYENTALTHKPQSGEGSVVQPLMGQLAMQTCTCSFKCSHGAALHAAPQTWQHEVRRAPGNFSRRLGARRLAVRTQIQTWAHINTTQQHTQNASWQRTNDGCCIGLAPRAAQNAAQDGLQAIQADVARHDDQHIGCNLHSTDHVAPGQTHLPLQATGDCRACQYARQQPNASSSSFSAPHDHAPCPGKLEALFLRDTLALGLMIMHRLHNGLTPSLHADSVHSENETLYSHS